LYNVVEVPAILMIGLWIGAQVWQGLGSLERLGEGGVAYLAHVGGAACGIIFGLIYRKQARAQGQTTWFDGSRY
jgi:membrane associated rhomboid family serine protease